MDAEYFASMIMPVKIVNKAKKPVIVSVLLVPQIMRAMESLYSPKAF